MRLVTKNCLLVIGIGLIALFWFDHKIVAELFTKDQFRTSGDDGVMLQYYAETFRLRLLQGKYPFSKDTQLLVPYGTEIAAADLGLLHGLVFLVLRPFLSMHASFQLMVLVNTLLTYGLMYKCLRLIKIPVNWSLLGAVVYAFMPFLGYWRITEHYTYMHHYLFPGLLWLLVKWQHSLNKTKYIWMGCIGGLVGVSILINFYYFMMLNLIILGWIIAHRLDRRWWVLLIIFSVSVGMIGLPVILGAKQNLKTLQEKQDQEVKPAYSAKLSGFWVASPASIYRKNEQNIKWEIWKPGEGTSYIGWYVTIGGLLSIWQWRKKKSRILSWGLLGWLGFLWLSLGPVIQEVTWWESELKVIRLALPSLYSALSVIIPFFGQLRSPVRFVIPAMFIGVMLSTYCFAVVSQKIKNNINRWVIFIIIAVLVLIDQVYIIDNSTYRTLNVPVEAYQLISRDKTNSTVLEIPLNLRDGYRSIGDIHTLAYMYGPVIHHHPVIGGYNSRIADQLFELYSKAEVTKFAFLASKPETEKYALGLIKHIPVETWNQSMLDFNIGYVLMPAKLKQYSEINSLLTQLDFALVLENEATLLYKKNQE